MRIPWRDIGSTRVMAVLFVTCVIFAAIFFVALTYPAGKVTYSSDLVPAPVPVVATTSTELIVTHVSTPAALKAVYLTSWAAGNRKFRKALLDLVDTTEINAVVIDVKDYTGRISFMVNDPDLAAFGSSEKRIPDVKEFVDVLHKKGVYVIARISSFQDSFLIKGHPEWAVKTNEGGVWADYKGVKWLDAGAEPVWKYLVSIGKEAYSVGFDELNFDYIRYPSDGNTKDISYSWSDGRTRQQVMRSFFSYLHDHFAASGIPLSIDLFGLTTSSEGDLGIGQNIYDALPYFDYICPMVYPSHFAHGFIGYEKPAEHPYEVVKYSMEKGIAKAISTTTKDKSLGIEPIASTTPQLYTRDVYDRNKIRPWLQAFDLGAIYTPAMVRAQIQATYDTGLTGWMLWDAASIYDKNDLAPKAAGGI